MKDLFHSARLVAGDMASTILLLVVLQLTHQPMLSVAAAMALGLAQVLWRLGRRQPVDVMQWVSLMLVLGAGAATFLTGNMRFVMLKPSVVSVILGCVMLRKGWMTRYLPANALIWAPDLAIVFGYLWSALMFASAAVNLGLALSFSVATWGTWISIYSIVSVLALFVIQFAATRITARRRSRAVASEPPARA